MLLGSKTWYETAYRRAVIDMHIPDWDEKFLSEFDAANYVDMLVKSRAQSVVAYAQSHVGLFNYPTKVGQQHRGLRGRNILAEIIERCHAHQIAVVVYTSLIFDRWAADTHPEWRMVTHQGKLQGEGGRQGVLCPNSPYREYVRSFAAEICENFDFEGLRFDMTFWPSLCFCSHCQQRFADEVGGEIPRTINWLDERWVAFARKREQWLQEFADVATSTVRKLKPQATVEHQSSTYPLNWQFGVTAGLTRENDFLQGDFYGDSLQGSFVRKLLEDLTPHRPFGYETSFSVELRDHTAMKSEALLEAKASAAIADAAAFIFIDAVDPIGTLNPQVHERMGRVFDRLMPYYPQLGGQRVQDIGIYYSLESKFNMASNGRGVDMPDLSDSHTASSMQVSRRLLAAHLPWGVITKGSLAKLDGLKLLIMSNVHMMDPEEVSAIRAWVERGGTLLATGGTSLVDKRGTLQGDFLLGDVLGVSIERSEWQDREHYIAPTPAGAPWFGTISAKYPIYVNGPVMQVRARSGAQVLATTTLPWPAPDASKFSSIHSNPPWEPTDRPEIVLNRFGQGRAVYASSLPENVDGLAATFVQLVRMLAGEVRFEATAPTAVEMTVFHQPDRHRYLLCLVNFQKDLPNIPIDGIDVRLRLTPERLRRIVRLPDQMVIKHQAIADVVTFRAPRLETLAMFSVETG
ncbi:MAG TPA: beta-galactosidase trimerization domain-containing protein [Pirellulales bacterium]|nr:beta-galactosidase trimerization domain-containing protein [Pirellulales bacterium]